MKKTAVVLFVKYPIPKRVKTRLIPFLGPQGSCEVYKHMVEDTFRRLSSLDIPLVVFFTPKNKHKAIHDWLGPRCTYYPQIGKNLGDRMISAFQQVFSQGVEQAILVGSDLPDLPQVFVHDAVIKLEDNDVVLGPAEDGGYYLVGWRKSSFSIEMFSGISWGTAEVYHQTLEVLNQLDRSVGFLPMWHDIDTFDDLRYLLTADDALSTKQWMQKYLKEQTSPTLCTEEC